MILTSTKCMFIIVGYEKCYDSPEDCSVCNIKLAELDPNEIYYCNECDSMYLGYNKYCECGNKYILMNGVLS